MQSPRIAVLALLLISTLAFSQDMHRGMPSMSSGSLNGKVTNNLGKPVPDARVEARSIRTGQVAASTYTSSNGSFEMVVPGGDYEVVAASGIAEARDRVSINDLDATVNLRLPSGNDDGGVAGDSVSVAQYKVPEKARNELHKAQSAAHKGKVDEVEKHLTEALNIYPDFSEALTMRAIDELDHNNLANATADLEHAIKSDASYGTAYLVLGAAYNVQKRWDDAARVLDRGLSLQPNSWQGFFELGKTYVGKADYQKALATLDKAQALAPQDYAPVHLVKAHVLLSQKNYNQAMGELQAYLDRAPKDDANSAQVRQAMQQMKAFTSASVKEPAH